MKHDGGLYTADLLHRTLDIAAMFDYMDKGSSIFRRGLPQNRYLQEPEVANVLRKVCYLNMVVEADDSLLTMCHRRGWLHADTIDPHTDKVGYIFPSPLHRWFVERKLFRFFPITPSQVSLFEFSIDVIRKFSPINLSNERRIGPGFLQRPPEAQYQDEFYRCSYELGASSMITFSEFGTANGRVDFYIPGKKWGIELLRNGQSLAEHSGRFSTGGRYERTLVIEDYIILDFRVKRVVATHPSLSRKFCRVPVIPHCYHLDLRQLHHVVFEEDYSKCTIFDNRASEICSFGLIY